MRLSRECKVRKHRNSDPLSKDSCVGKAIDPRILSAASALDAGAARQSVPLPPKILILSMPHGAAHQRAAKALREAFAALRSDAQVEVIDTLQHCTAWFRAYYSSYLIPLTIWPGLYRWIENRQHQSESTNPGWVFHRGAQPLFRYLRDFAPDVVIATEVGTCELAAMYKRESPANFLLVGLELMDFNRAWIQPEADLFLATHVDLAAELVAEGASTAKVVTTGQPIDPVFASLPDRRTARDKLGIKPDAVQILILFGGTGHGNPERILAEVARVQQPHEIVLVTGRNQRLEERLRKRLGSLPHVRVLGWVDNMQEWMVASDLMISKPGGGTLNEGFACGLPMLAFDPLPGNEERTCRWIEKWGAGIWIKKPEDLAPQIESLLADPAQLAALRQQAGALARPQAARDGALTILEMLSRKAQAPAVT
jgi:processive 1,2-diacylglycerol beta-glucosyltransferase